MPIPFTLTDFGRAYLAQLRETELRLRLELRHVQDDAIKQVPTESERRGHQPG